MVIGKTADFTIYRRYVLVRCYGGFARYYKRYSAFVYHYTVRFVNNSKIKALLNGIFYSFCNKVTEEIKAAFSCGDIKHVTAIRLLLFFL